MRVAGYIRVSTDGQTGEDRFGLDVQREQITKYCQDNGMEIIRWYSDEGESGAKERPGFDEIVYGDVVNPPIEAIVVAKSDRVARDIEIYYYYKMLLRKKDIALISIAEDFGKFGVFADMLESFTLCVAKMERENINKRTSAGRAVKASRGGYSGGRAPLGYKVSNGMLVQDPEQAESVRKIFALRKQGVPLRTICDMLNKEGRRCKSGAEFTAGSLVVILNNEPFYRGMYKYGNGEWVRGQHMPILGKEE